jgi:hypothetical protein
MSSLAAGDFLYRSNIFGLNPTSGVASVVPIGTFDNIVETMIDRIRYIADVNMANVADSTGWLGIAADAGQNGSDKSLVRYDNVKPDAVKNINEALAGFTGISSLPALPAFPTLPADLDIDVENFKGNVDALIDKLQNSWVSHFLPSTTDTSRYDSLMTFILNGTDDTSVKTILDGLYTDMQNALTSTVGGLVSSITTQASQLQTTLAAQIAALQPMIDQAFANANDNTAEVAFVRARDQAAREAARLEREAIADWASRGFAMPSGVILAAQAEQRNATLFASAEVAAQQAIKAQEMNLEIAKGAVSAWMQAAELQIRSNIEMARLTTEVTLRQAAMQMDKDRELAKAAFEHLGLRLDFTKFAGDFALKYRIAAIEGMNNLINAYANLTNATENWYAKIADAKRGAILALVEYYRAGLQYADMGVKTMLTNNENDIRWAQVAADFITRAVANHVQAAVATGDVYGRVAAAALNGMNAIVNAQAQIAATVTGA